MAGDILELWGCTPEPLGNYLKGLGIFRLIAEQADPVARAWWKGGFLHILQSKWDDSGTTRKEDKLTDWLLNECRFTPLVAPWQTGTGYLPIGKRSAGGEALQALLAASQPGTEYFREAFRDFAVTREVAIGCNPSKWLAEIAQSSADVTDADLHRTLRNRVRSAATLKWLDVVGTVLPTSQDSDSPLWFPILASGGGEASGQYIVNHQQRLHSALLGDQGASRCRLRSSLFGGNYTDSLEADSMGAMYYPSLMKAPNVGQDFLPDPQRRVNPWDFILLLEGSLTWSLAATRRQGVTSDRGSFPFYCRSSFGRVTAIGPREVEGAEKSIANGELWCPIWSRPSRLTEVQRIFGEGRLQIGEKACSRSLDFALAMRGLGLDRGIDAFFRYSLLERSGSGRQTTLLAVPCGSFVPDQSASLSLVSELQPFAENISSNLVDSGQQQRRLMQARIEFEQTWFAATASSTSMNSDGLASLFSDLLVSAGRLMRELGTNTAKPGMVKIKRGEKTAERNVPPVGLLGRRWNTALDGADSSPAFRLARAVAGMTAWGQGPDHESAAVESLRANLFLLKCQGKAWIWDGTSRAAVWARGATIEANLAAVLRRRLVDAQRGTGDGLPLWSPYGAGFEDLLAFWNGAVDDARLTDLIHGLSLIDQGRWVVVNIDAWQSSREPTPDLQTGAVWFGADDEPRTTSRDVEWNGRRLLDTSELRAAFELPRVYHLLKLCFVGGRLPRRPVEGLGVKRSGEEPFPPACLDVITLLEAGRLAEAVGIAARRLRAKGYPTVLRESDINVLDLDLSQCRRLAGMLLIPVRHPGVLAALVIKPESST